MSSARGNATRNRPQKHQNKTVFKNDLHDSSHQTKLLNSLQIAGVCPRCKDILDWKIKYKKYKPLTAPRKCNGCDQKTVKHAYHMLCRPCAKDKKVCAKCCKSAENEDTVDDSQPSYTTEITTMLKGLPERKRRSMLRYINKQQEDGESLPKIMLQVEDLVAKIEKSMNLGIDDEDDEDFFGEGSISSDKSIEEK